MTIENLRVAQTVFMTRDRDLARQLMEEKVEIRRLERLSAQRHLTRLREGRGKPAHLVAASGYPARPQAGECAYRLRSHIRFWMTRTC